MLNRSTISGYPCLSWSWRNNFQLFITEDEGTVTVPHMDLFGWSCFPVCTFYTQCVERFLSCNDTLCQVLFCIWGDHKIFHSFNVVNHICWLVCVEPILNPRDKFSLIMVKILLIWRWIQFANIWMRNFVSLCIYIRNIVIFL